VANLVTDDAELIRDTRRQWTEHLQRPRSEVDGAPGGVVDLRWRPLASADQSTLCVPKSTSVQVTNLAAWLAVVGHDRDPCWSASPTSPSPTPSPRCGYYR